MVDSVDVQERRKKKWIKVLQALSMKGCGHGSL